MVLLLLSAIYEPLREQRCLFYHHSLFDSFKIAILEFSDRRKRGFILSLTIVKYGRASWMGSVRLSIILSYSLRWVSFLHRSGGRILLRIESQCVGMGLLVPKFPSYLSDKLLLLIFPGFNNLQSSCNFFKFKDFGKY